MRLIYKYLDRTGEHSHATGKVYQLVHSLDHNSPLSVGYQNFI